MDKENILKNLLSSIFDKSLAKLEKNTTEHFEIIKNSIDMANKVSNLCLDLYKKTAQSSHIKKRHNSLMKSNDNNTIALNKIPLIPKLAVKSLQKTSSPHNSSRDDEKSPNNKIFTPITQKNKILPKTPKRADSRGFANPHKNLGNQSLNTNKSVKIIFNHSKDKPSINIKNAQGNGNLLNNSRSSVKRRSLKSTTKNNINCNNANPNNNSTINKSRNSISIAAKGRKQSCNNSISNNKIINDINNSFKINVENDLNNNITTISKKRNKLLIDESSKNKMKYMETNLQNDVDSHNEEDLLIAPLSELDFANNENNNFLFNNDSTLISNNNNNKSIISLTKSQLNSHFQMEEFSEAYFHLILNFLNKYDICKLLFLNKSFNNLIKRQFIDNLEKDKKNYQDIISKIKKEEITNDYKPNKLEISRGTKKALSLLNENILYKLFSESDPPCNDILRIFILYFQIINHPLSKKIWNKQFFWSECCKYFLELSDGKIGDLLEYNITKGLVLTKDNLFQIIRLVGENTKKIGPGYFSKTSNTTGLFAFAIKDVLDYMGITSDKKIDKANRYWTYNKAVRAIDERIEYLKKIV